MGGASSGGSSGPLNTVKLGVRVEALRSRTVSSSGMGSVSMTVIVGVLTGSPLLARSANFGRLRSGRTELSGGSLLVGVGVVSTPMAGLPADSLWRLPSRVFVAWVVSSARLSIAV